MTLTLKIRHNHELRDWAPVLKAMAQSDRFFATQFDICHLNTIVCCETTSKQGLKILHIPKP